MAKKARIIAVTETTNGIITAEYDTGSTKTYQADKLPATVKAWMDSHAATDPQAEPITQPEPIPERITTADPIPQAITTPAADPEPITPAATDHPDIYAGNIPSLPAVIQPEPAGAAESVLFGVMLSMAIIWHVSVQLATLAVMAAYNMVWLAWSHRQDIAAAIITAATTTARITTTVIIPQGIKAARITAAAIHAAGIEAVKAAAILIFTAGITLSR